MDIQRKDGDGGRICRKCGEWKEWNKCCKAKRSKYGYGALCHSCNTAQAKIRYKRNPSKYQERARRWYASNKDKDGFKEANHKRHKEWAVKNKEWLSSYHKEYRKDNDDLRNYLAERARRRRNELHVVYIKHLVCQIPECRKLGVKQREIPEGAAIIHRVRERIIMRRQGQVTK